ncbi:TPA: helix-turn-helix domain-containing protein [Staphylococcus pseudintermedius]
MVEIDFLLSNKMRRTRVLKNITLSEASTQIGVSRKTLSLLERGLLSRMKKSTYIKIINWLLKNEELNNYATTTKQ